MFSAFTHVRRRFFGAARFAVIKRNAFRKQGKEVKRSPLDQMLPYGVLGSIIRPTLFTVMVGGTAVWLAEYVKNKKGGWKQWLEIPELKLSHDSPFYGVVQFWHNINPGYKLGALLSAINVGVFLLWKIPAFYIPMVSWFAQAPINSRQLSFLLTCFSQRQTPHLVNNIIAMGYLLQVGNEQIGTEQFLALYIAGGVFGNLGSHMCKLIHNQHNIVSLGASGSVFAWLGAVLWLNSDKPIWLLEHIPITNGTVLVITMLVSAYAMIVRPSSVIDHGAHFAGAFFGICYAKWLIYKGKINEPPHGDSPQIKDKA